MTFFDLPSALDHADITFVPATANLTYEDDIGSTEPRRHDGRSQDACIATTHCFLRHQLRGISLEQALAKFNPANDDAVTLLLVKLITQP